VRELDPAALSSPNTHTIFEDMTLGKFLMAGYRGHIGNFRIPQLEAFLVH
jgi:hypothetical protein